MRRNVSVVKYLLNVFIRLSKTYSRRELVCEFRKGVEELYRSFDSTIADKISLRKDIELVYKILGINNTNYIKIDITVNRVSVLLPIMNSVDNLILKGYSCDKIKRTLKIWLNNGAISKTIYQYIIMIYKLNDNIRVKVEIVKNDKSVNNAAYKMDTNKNPIGEKDIYTEIPLEDRLEFIFNLFKLYEDKNSKEFIHCVNSRLHITLMFTNREIFTIANSYPAVDIKQITKLTFCFLYALYEQDEYNNKARRQVFESQIFPLFSGFAYIKYKATYDSCRPSISNYKKENVGYKLGEGEEVLYRIRNSDPCRCTYNYFTLKETVKYLINKFDNLDSFDPRLIDSFDTSLIE